MPTQIEPSSYKDRAAVTMKTSVLSAQIMPSRGSTMTSLRWLPAGIELLRQRAGDRFLAGSYGGSFVAAERAGFDEMLPTIDACFCDQEPWQGTPMPDHGELWAIPWEYETAGEELVLKVAGVRFPYVLEKRLRFRDDSVLRIDYSLRNLSPFDLPFLWAAHPDFALHADAELELPGGVTELVRLFGTGAVYGESVRWPFHVEPDGASRDLRQVRASGTARAAKYYVRGRMPEGWCAVRFPRLGMRVKLSFPVEKVPYLAILPNEGGIDGLRELFIEPCTASYDRPDLARLRGELSVLPARGSLTWYLEIAVGPTETH